MKNKILFIIFIFIVFIGFCLNLRYTEKPVKHKVLDVIRADLFYVDMNDNSKIDKNELFKLKDVYALSPELNEFSIKHSQKLNIDKFDYLKAGYIAQKWAIDNLKGRDIIITSIIKDDTKTYNYITAEYDNYDLSRFYLENGLAFANPDSNSNYTIYQNINQIKYNANEISKLDFVLLNSNSKVYHRLNCELIHLMHNAKLILSKHIKDFKPCKNCNISNEISNLKIPDNIKADLYKNFGNIELYFTNPLIYKKPDSSCSNLVCKRLVDEINCAKFSIDVALYGFGDITEIYKALQNANKRGVKIRAITDYSAKMNELYPKTQNFIKEFSAITDKNEIIMHNKFFIFDNNKVFTGSANISPSGIGGYSANSIAIIKSEKIANRYKNEFEQMYKGNFSTKKVKYPIISDNNISTYFSPKDDIKNMIVSKINSSKEEICVSAFYLTNKDIINALINAKSRNVKVYIILDAVSANNFKDRVQLLRKSKIAVLVENWGGKDHEKTILIDNKTLILGSLNFSNAALNKNDENLLVIENTEIAKFYRNYFFFLFNSVDKKYLYLIPRAEGKESINSCSDGIDNNFDDKIDKDDDGCK